MNATGGVPIDLILLGMVAAFLVLRLRSILGRRTGFEGTPAAPARPAAAASPVIEGRAEPMAAPVTRAVPDPATPLGETLARIAASDPSFLPARFLQGAEAAFRMIVEGFATGNRVALRKLLADGAYAAFESAIAAREAAGETQRSEIRSVDQAEITDAHLQGGLADITVRFTSTQVSFVTGADGLPVSGVDGITELVDVWTFERNTGAAGVAWKLADAVSG
ncbi:MAG: Tim44/TimA family putative adaptor protein [Janthinobacterium lividum]